ncbi:rod-binding protein [Bacteriovoracaceae bacterium]|nr:rod-binding protein [Bacteriovoracaceae bacterium]
MDTLINGNVANSPLNNRQIKAGQRRAPEIPKAYQEVASGMEAQFINHMFQEMRKTIKKGKEDSTAVKLYQSLMDYESAKTMSKREDGGLGLKELILKQIVPNYDQYKKAILSQKAEKLNNSQTSLHEAANEYKKIGDQL